MKKEYMKPMIVFENFKMNTSIAAECRYNVTSNDTNSCGVDPDIGFKIFAGGGCDYTPQDIEKIVGEDAICYHVPTADVNVFMS